MQETQEMQQQNGNEGWTVVSYKKKSANPTTKNTVTNNNSNNDSSPGSHQDWNQVVFRKKVTPYQTGHQHQQQTVVVSKGVKGQRKDYDVKHMAKIANETERFTVKHVDREFARKIQQARQKLNLTQKDLAQKMNIPHSIVTKYENGTAISDGPTIQKFQRFLHI